MKTINIKGKDYIPVNERIKEFRAKHPNYSLISEIMNLTEDSCIIKASVLDENGVVKATGFAQEDRTSSMVNKTSFVENCETSAWGRALGNFGIGIDVSIASAEEVTIAIAKQEKQGGDYVFGSGKHVGKSIREVYASDENYLHFLMENEKVSKTIKDNIEEFLAEV